MDLPWDTFTNRLSFSDYSVEVFGNVLLVSGEIEVGDAGRFKAHLVGETSPM